MPFDQEGFVIGHLLVDWGNLLLALNMNIDNGFLEKFVSLLISKNNKDKPSITSDLQKSISIINKIYMKKQFLSDLIRLKDHSKKMKTT